MCFAPLQDMHNGPVIVSANFCEALRLIPPLGTVQLTWIKFYCGVHGYWDTRMQSDFFCEAFSTKLSTWKVQSKYRTPSSNTRYATLHAVYTTDVQQPELICRLYYTVYRTGLYSWWVWELYVQVLRDVACWSLWNLWSRFHPFIRLVDNCTPSVHDTTDIRTHQNSEHVRD